MIGSDPTSMKDMLATAFTRASAAKDKAGKKDDSDPAFLLSANLQDLTGRLRDLADGASDNARSGVAQAESFTLQAAESMGKEIGKQGFDVRV